MDYGFDVSGVTSRNTDSILREAVFLEAADKRLRIKKFERRLQYWSNQPEGDENSMLCIEIIQNLERPWDVSERAGRPKYSAQDLVKMYGEMFPKEVKKE